MAAGPGDYAAAIDSAERQAPGQPGAWVLSSVLTGYTNPAYCPIYLDTFDSYAPGPLASQGAWSPMTTVTRTGTTIVRSMWRWPIRL